MTRDGLVEQRPLGRIEITPAALSGLVRRAAESVTGVQVRRSRRSVGIESVPDLHVTVAIDAGTEAPLPVTGEGVQAAVAIAVEATTGRRPVVDVTIEAVRA
jgi:uncharacterized alkaline shock family protein YloU